MAERRGAAGAGPDVLILDIRPQAMLGLIRRSGGGFRHLIHTGHGGPVRYLPFHYWQDSEALEVLEVMEAEDLAKARPGDMGWVDPLKDVLRPSLEPLSDPLTALSLLTPGSGADRDCRRVAWRMAGIMLDHLLEPLAVRLAEESWRFQDSLVLVMAPPWTGRLAQAALKAALLARGITGVHFVDRGLAAAAGAARFLGPMRLGVLLDDGGTPRLEAFSALLEGKELLVRREGLRELPECGQTRLVRRLAGPVGGKGGWDLSDLSEAEAERVLDLAAGLPVLADGALLKRSRELDLTGYGNWLGETFSQNLREEAGERLEQALKDLALVDAPLVPACGLWVSLFQESLLSNEVLFTHFLPPERPAWSLAEAVSRVDPDLGRGVRLDDGCAWWMEGAGMPVRLGPGWEWERHGGPGVVESFCLSRAEEWEGYDEPRPGKVYWGPGQNLRLNALAGEFELERDGSEGTGRLGLEIRRERHGGIAWGRLAGTGLGDGEPAVLRNPRTCRWLGPELVSLQGGSRI